MKNKYFVVTIEENGKYLSHLLVVSENVNILSALKIKNIVCANVFSTKKKAKEIVDYWNECYKRNGTYMYQ